MIIFDVAHPANVHYFKQIAKVLETDNNEVLFTARDKDVTIELLKEFNFPFVRMLKYNNSAGIIGKTLYQIRVSVKSVYILLQKRPNVVISFSSAYFAFACWLCGVKHICFDDTEHAKLNRILYLPFVKNIITPSSYTLDLGTKHLRFKGSMEEFYLSKKAFSPNNQVLERYGLKEGNYVFLRFVSWNAIHDVGHKGLSRDQVEILIKLIQSYNLSIVFSSEDNFFKEEKSCIIPKSADVHSLMYFSRLFVGEGATMAVESCKLGVRSVYLNSLPTMGYVQEEIQRGMLWKPENFKELLNRVEYLVTTDYQRVDRSKREHLPMLISLVKKPIEQNKYLF